MLGLNATQLNLAEMDTVLLSGFHMQLAFLVLHKREGAQGSPQGQRSHNGWLKGSQLQHTACFHQGHPLISLGSIEVWTKV